MEKEKDAGGVAVLPCRRHQEDVIVLYEHVGHTIIIHHGIVRIRIPLNIDPNNENLRDLLETP